MSCTVTRLTLELEQSACQSVQNRMVDGSACRGVLLVGRFCKGCRCDLAHTREHCIHPRFPCVQHGVLPQTSANQRLGLAIAQRSASCLLTKVEDSAS